MSVVFEGCVVQGWRLVVVWRPQQCLGMVGEVALMSVVGGCAVQARRLVVVWGAVQGSSVVMVR
jgi:hypothetical protein